MSEARNSAQRAKTASIDLGMTSGEIRNEALYTMANALRNNADDILLANDQDMENGRNLNVADSLLDRLYLDHGRIEDMALALENLASLPDPLGKVLDITTLENGLEITKISVPLGVVAMVYEARPNVTSDAAGICIKSGNACVLRGGSLAINSNLAISKTLANAAVSSGMPKGSIISIESVDRAETDELLGLHGLVDVLIPRGGTGLIQHCINHAKVPVIETGTGNCHIYIQAKADLEKAIPIIINAKTQRVGVCNAAESLLIDQTIVQNALPPILAALNNAGVRIHGDTIVQNIGETIDIPIIPATPEDWGKEYLDMDISVKVVKDYHDAISHINQYGTHHSEAIVTEDTKIADTFLSSIDAAAVYVNASTRFTDGAEFGLGAEIGISTQKLHVRGPFAIDALTTYKYIIRGTGQVRA